MSFLDQVIAQLCCRDMVLTKSLTSLNRLRASLFVMFSPLNAKNRLASGSIKVIWISYVQYNFRDVAQGSVPISVLSIKLVITSALHNI